MANNTFLGSFVENGVLLISPLKEALSSELALRKLMLDLGWEIPSPPVTQAQQIVSAIENLIADFENLSGTPTEADIIAILVQIGDVYASIKSFTSAVANITGGISPLQSVFINEFPSDLSSYLITTFLSKKHNTLYSFLRALNIIEFAYVDVNPPRPSYTKIKINYNRFGQLISNPLELVKTSIKWNTIDFEIEDFFETCTNYLASINVPAVINETDPLEKHLVYHNIFNNTDVITNAVHVYLIELLVGNKYEYLGLKFLGSLGQSITDTGIIIRLDIPSGINVNQQVTDDLNLDLGFSSAIGQDFALLIKPNSIQFKRISQTAFPESSFNVRLTYNPDTPTLIMGRSEGTRLQLKGAGLGLEANFVDPLEVAFEVDLSGLVLVVSPGESDNFIKKIFGDGPKEISFPLTIRWSSKTGISFKGSGSFEYSVAAHFKIGPLEFNEVIVSLSMPAGSNAVRGNIGTSITGIIGPVTFTVKNIGIKVQLDLTEGNVGPFGIGIGFKPPTGIGISIEADPVSGGGFLNFDESTSTYTGGLELNFSKISLKAIGILTTKMPDGGDGFSLLIIITAEFTPIQLGMGFTLNGVGGLLGLNRTMNTDRLRTGIKDNTLDSILFPQDIVKNANVIISNIGQAFPIKRDRFIIGPMAKLGWGTPTLITIEIGVLIEVPTPVVIAIVGVIKALLPSDNNRIIAIQVNFLGVIDFGKKYLSFDASLFDSKILFFSLYGDMALRVYWGDKPNFLLSVGGFHPKFTPPPMNLPQMQRLAIELANSNNLKIRIETYFAVTSNSAQFGARLEARAKAWKIEAIGALWFDILFQFSPFYFNANMGAMFAIKMGSRELLSVHLELSLEGPNPWRAQGRASFKVLGVRVNVSFDKTFGQVRVEPIEMAELWGKFNDAVLNKDSWEVIGPDRSHQTVAFREVPDGNTDLVIDPFGALRFNQKLVPMNISLSKYGTAKIKDVNKFQVTSLVLTDADNNTQTITPTITQDYFARNEFFYMTDDEKLSKESYERFDSGFSIGSTDEIYVSAYTNRVCAYEDITIDTRPDWRFRLVAANAIDLDIAMFDRHVSNNYISEAKLSNSSAMVIADGPRSTEVLKEEYFVMNRNTMQKVQGYNLADKYDNAAAADMALGAARNGWPADAANFIVVNSFELQTV